MAQHPPIEALDECLQAHAAMRGDAGRLAALLGILARDGLAGPPMPAQGGTLDRWRALAAVARFDLSLAKLYEGHTDALAILNELGAPPPPVGSTWGMWAAEPPGARVTRHEVGNGRLELRGRKQWCSGAAHLSHALLTTWSAEGEGPYLAAVALDQPGISFHSDAWQAVGMAASTSIDVDFEHAVADAVGGQGDYLTRPGFWQGGAGIAACWHGGATALAAALREATAPDESKAWHRLLRLGAVDTVLSASASLLRETAAWIDANPTASAQAPALRARSAAESAAQVVLADVGRALGAAPFCRDAPFARLAADLPVFVRQSHGDRDLSALGALVARDDATPGWLL